MTNDKFAGILDRLDFWMAQDARIQKAYDNFCKEIAPTSYELIIEQSAASVFIDGIAMLAPELKEDLEYYAWELPTMDTAEGKRNGTEFDLKDREQFVSFVLAQ